VKARPLVVGTVALVVAACGGEDSTLGPEPRQLDLGVSTVPAYVPAVESDVLDDVSVSPLPPGTHTLGVFTPRVEVSVGDGWHLLDQATGAVAFSDEAALLSSSSTRLLEFVNLGQAQRLDPPYRPTAAVADGVDQTRSPVPRDVHGWLDSLEQIEVGDPSTTTVAGVDAATFDFVVSDLPDDDLFGDVGARFLFLLTLDATEVPFFGISESTVGQMWLVDDGDSRLAIVASAPASDTDADAFFAAAADVVETLRVE